MVERRATRRISGVSELHFSGAGDFSASASVRDLSRGGLGAIYVADDVLSRVSMGQRLGFSFVLATGPVSGEAEVISVGLQDGRFSVKFVTLADAAAEENLTGFLDSPLAGAGD